MSPSSAIGSTDLNELCFPNTWRHLVIATLSPGWVLGGAGKPELLTAGTELLTAGTRKASWFLFLFFLCVFSSAFI